MKDRLREWLAMFRQQPPGAQMAVAGLVLLLAVLAFSEIYQALQPAAPNSAPSVEQQPVNPAATPTPVDASQLPATEPLPSVATRTAVPDPAFVPAPAVDSTAIFDPPSDASTHLLTPLLPPAADQPAVRRPQLAIILDDIGNSAVAGQRALDLPGSITFAVLPFTPHGHWLAEEAHRRQRDVMLHAPMSNLAGMELGPGGMTLDMDECTLRRTLRAAIADIPHVRGVNNHTGSELTTYRQPMEWVMEELKALNLFFVDSLTHSSSVAADIAVEHNIPTLKRHVFLDNIAEFDLIAIEFQRALAIARRDGFAVAIGHPYPATLAYLEQALPALEQQGIELVRVSELLTSQ